MHAYPVGMSGGHLLICDNGQTLLLNTGCPVSMGTRQFFVLLGRQIPVLQRYQGMTVAQWSEIIGINIDGVLGSDVLGRHSVAIDPSAGQVVFDGDSLPGARGRVVPLDTVAGMPVVNVGFGGGRLRMLLHTGATLSCLRDVDTKSLTCVGVVRDCYPGLGEFTTELRRVPLLFGDQPVNLECGLMPAELERALRPADVHGVVGTNLLESFAVQWGAGFTELSLAALPVTAPVVNPEYEMPQPIHHTPSPRAAQGLAL